MRLYCHRNSASSTSSTSSGNHLIDICGCYSNTAGANLNLDRGSSSSFNRTQEPCLSNTITADEEAIPRIWDAATSSYRYSYSYPEAICDWDRRYSCLWRNRLFDFAIHRHSVSSAFSSSDRIASTNPRNSYANAASADRRACCSNSASSSV